MGLISKYRGDINLTGDVERVYMVFNTAPDVPVDVSRFSIRRELNKIPVAEVVIPVGDKMGSVWSSLPWASLVSTPFIQDLNGMDVTIFIKYTCGGSFISDISNLGKAIKNKVSSSSTPATVLFRGKIVSNMVAVSASASETHIVLSVQHKISDLLKISLGTYFYTHGSMAPYTTIAQMQALQATNLCNYAYTTNGSMVAKAFTELKTKNELNIVTYVQKIVDIISAARFVDAPGMWEALLKKQEALSAQYPYITGKVYPIVSGVSEMVFFRSMMDLILKYAKSVNLLAAVQAALTSTAFDLVLAPNNLDTVEIMPNMAHVSQKINTILDTSMIVDMVASIDKKEAFNAPDRVKVTAGNKWTYKDSNGKDQPMIVTSEYPKETQYELEQKAIEEAKAKAAEEAAKYLPADPGFLDSFGQEGYDGLCEELNTEIEKIATQIGIEAQLALPEQSVMAVPLPEWVGQCTPAEAQKIADGYAEMVYLNNLNIGKVVKVDLTPIASIEGDVDTDLAADSDPTKLDLTKLYTRLGKQIVFVIPRASGNLEIWKDNPNVEYSGVLSSHEVSYNKASNGGSRLTVTVTIGYVGPYENSSSKLISHPFYKSS